MTMERTSSKGNPWRLATAVYQAMDALTGASTTHAPASAASSSTMVAPEAAEAAAALTGRARDSRRDEATMTAATATPVRMDASTTSKKSVTLSSSSTDKMKNKKKKGLLGIDSSENGAGSASSVVLWYRRLYTFSALVFVSLFAGGIVYIVMTYIKRYRKRVADYDATSVKLGREVRAQESVSDHFSSLQRLPGLGMAPLRCAIRQTMDLSSVTTPLVNARLQKQPSSSSSPSASAVPSPSSELLGSSPTTPLVNGSGSSNLNGSLLTRPAMLDQIHPLTPAAKLRLWEQYKVSAFARVLLSEFSMAVTILMLRIHLNLLGRQLFLAGDDADAEREGLTEQTQQHFLLLAEGISNREVTLKDLARDAIAASELVLGNVSLKAKLTRADLRRLIKSAMKELASNALRVTKYGSSNSIDANRVVDESIGDEDQEDMDHHDMKNVLSSFLGEGISASAETSSGRLDAAEMLALTNLSHQAKEVLHTKSCSAAVMQSVCSAHEITLNRIAKDMASQRSTSDRASSNDTTSKEKSTDGTAGDEDILDTPTPLAKLIPSIERASLEILDDCEDLEESMAKNSSIVAFFADVYAGHV